MGENLYVVKTNLTASRLSDKRIVMSRRTKARPKAAARTTPYHHGDLRSALLRAADTELVEKGVEDFSLRGVAKRAGVSHAAPAHHFGDVTGLLTALAAVGFERFVAMQRARQQKAEENGRAQLVAAGLGYIDFAMANPALFRLMFSSNRPDHNDPILARAARAAFDHLVQGVKQLRGVDPHGHEAAMLDVMAAWAIAHGLADLMNAGRLRYLADLPQSEREAAIADVLGRVVVG